MLRNKSGFTAVELAMTLAIMAIIATFFMPPYLHWLQTSRISGAATNLMGDIEMAKIRAIRENSFVAIQFQATNYTVFLDNGEGGGTAGDWIRNGSEAVVRFRDLPSGVSIDTATMTLANDRARFNGRGLPPEIAASENIIINNAVGTRTLILNRLGNVELNG